MFDTMFLTKVTGGFCGAFLIFLFGGWAAEGIYAGGGHGEGEQAYVIEVASAEGDAPAEVVEEGPPFADLLAAADPAAGEATFGRACGSCHKAEEGVNGQGPSLYGVVGRPVDAVADYDYSGALELVVDVWTPDHINSLITNPKEYAPGTKMTYPGMRSATDRADVIAYLATIGG
jgi:cytochrome c